MNPMEIPMTVLLRAATQSPTPDFVDEFAIEDTSFACCSKKDLKPLFGNSFCRMNLFDEHCERHVEVFMSL